MQEISLNFIFTSMMPETCSPFNALHTYPTLFLAPIEGTLPFNLHRKSSYPSCIELLLSLQHGSYGTSYGFEG